jgi:hypothetical protein
MKIAIYVWAKRKISLPSTQFYCEPKTALKKKSILNLFQKTILVMANSFSNQFNQFNAENSLN